MRLHSLLFPPSRIHIRRTERERPQSIFTFIPIFNVVKSTNERDRRERRPFAYEKTRSFFSTSSGWVRPSVITPKPHVAPNYADKFFLLSLSVIYFWLFFFKFSWFVLSFRMTSFGSGFKKNSLKGHSLVDDVELESKERWVSLVATEILCQRGIECVGGVGGSRGGSGRYCFGVSIGTTRCLWWNCLDLWRINKSLNSSNPLFSLFVCVF